MRTPFMGSATCVATIRWLFLDPFKIYDLRVKPWRDGNFFLKRSFFSLSQNIRLRIRTFNGGFPFHFWIALQLRWQNQMEILDTQNSSNKTLKTEPNFSFLTPLVVKFFWKMHSVNARFAWFLPRKACWCFLVTRSAKPSGHSFREMPFSLPRPFASARLMALKNLLKEISYTKKTLRIFVQHGYTKSDFFSSLFQMMKSQIGDVNPFS